MIGVKEFSMADFIFRRAFSPNDKNIDIEERIRLCRWRGYEGCRAGEPTGIGRIIRSNILDKIDWKPFDDHAHGSMDCTMYHKILNAGGRIQCVNDPKYVALSISTNLWSNMRIFEQHWNDTTENERIDHTILGEFPEALQFFNELKYKPDETSK